MESSQTSRSNRRCTECRAAGEECVPERDGIRVACLRCTEKGSFCLFMDVPGEYGDHEYILVMGQEADRNRFLEICSGYDESKVVRVSESSKSVLFILVDEG